MATLVTVVGFPRSICNHSLLLLVFAHQAPTLPDLATRFKRPRWAAWALLWMVDAVMALSWIRPSSIPSDMEQRCPYKTEIYSLLTKKGREHRAVISQIIIKIGLVLSNFCINGNRCLRVSFFQVSLLMKRHVVFHSKYIIKLIFQLATISEHYAWLANTTSKSTCRITIMLTIFIFWMIFS